MKTIQRYLKMMLVLVAMLMGIQAKAEKQPYVVYSIENKTLTFYYDENMSSNGGILIDEDYGDGYNDLPSWNMNLGTTKVVFDRSFAGYHPTTTRSWFSTNFSSLKEIEGLDNLNTSQVTDMGLMFRDCIALEELDLSSFNTGNVTKMNSMFLHCTSLKKLNVCFDTSKVTDMTEMFYQCSQLEELDVSSFNTSNVVYMQGVFSYCSSLKSLDLRNFDLSGVASIAFLFEGCTALERIDLSKSSTNNLGNMDGVFKGCQSLTSLDLSSFDTHNVNNMEQLFYECKNLTTIYVGDKWSTSNVDERYSYFLFNGCEKLVGGAGTAYSNTPYDHLLYARIDGGPSSETPGYFTYKKPSGISTGNLQVISDMSQVTSDEWNTIDGKKIGGKPTKRGVYIHNGKKVVVR
ncbi:MAG: BspA family leucine-rich repeat surface protein [Prevotella sp.]|nr:BspA family leucine-rich repeat surface protein [Prevotella sp.]